MELLDNQNYLDQHDTHGALAAAGAEWEQLSAKLELVFVGERDMPIAQVVVAGMGGSALAGGLAQDWLELEVPFEVVRDYNLPSYVGPGTLVIASSFSGNTEETLSALEEAIGRGAQIAVTAGGGKLWQAAEAQQLSRIMLPKVTQPRMGVFVNLLAVLQILEQYGLINDKLVKELASTQTWLQEMTQHWVGSVSSHDNLAKQLAWQCTGKTPVVYSSSAMQSLAYKWKISFNENSKNVAFCGSLPEFNHNEFIGWSSHPIMKPYTVIDLVSSHDHPRVKKRFDVSDRMLSGKRPHSETVNLGGETVLQQLLWGFVLADFTSIYLGILNGVDPTPVELVERFKEELNKQ